MATSDGLADTVEMALLSIEERAAGTSRIEGLLERVTDGEQPRLDLALRTMRRRQTLLGDAYPFDVQDVAIRRDDAWPSLRQCKGTWAMARRQCASRGHPIADGPKSSPRPSSGSRA